MRIGIGYDLHRLGAARPLRLGGVTIPDAPGLEGHSDADCLLHAVADALLGAAALGDLGEHFPDTDPAFLGADSAGLLSRVVEMLSRAGYAPANVDCTVVAERPKLAPFRAEMRRAVAAALALPEEAVGVKFTTNEGLGEIGRGEAIACHAVCLIRTR